MFSPPFGKKFSSATHAAVFAEVRVDEELSVVRVTRIVCAVAAGRIPNPTTARSQISAQLSWGSAKRCTRTPPTITTSGAAWRTVSQTIHPFQCRRYDINVVFVDERIPRLARWA